MGWYLDHCFTIWNKDFPKNTFEPIYLSTKKIRRNKIKYLKKIMDDKELIQKLIIDPYFNIYTRNGLEYMLSQHNHNDMDIYLVDFNNVKGMNKNMGYQKVNDLFKEVFGILKKDFIIGRAFSGDEIFFCTDNFTVGLEEIISTCKEHNLELESIKYTFHPYYDKISDVLEKMIDSLHEQSNGKNRNN